MPRGSSVIDFGAFPGVSDVSLAITGQTFIGTASNVEAWLRIADSADHLADEHRIETLSVSAGNIVAGVGFTIYAQNTSQLNEPLIILSRAAYGSQGGQGTQIYGKWNVDWVWV